MLSVASFICLLETNENPPFSINSLYALVDEGATIGAFSRVWHWVHIALGLLSESCSFVQNVFVEIACRKQRQDSEQRVGV